MKKLVFGATIKLSLDGKNGIMKKVFAEAKAFSSEYDVYIWGFTNNEVVYFHNDEKHIVGSFKNKAERRKLYFTELKNFAIAEKADVFYFRYATTDFFLLDMLKAFKKSGITNIVEIPTYPYNGEFKSNLKRRAIYALDVMLRGKLKKYTDRIVIFTGKYDSIFNIPTIPTMNGVDYDDITPVIREEHDDIKLIAVASMLPHHGFDRLLEGMKKYYDSEPIKKVTALIVGDGEELSKYQELVSNSKCSDHIQFAGNLFGDELNNAFYNADIAVGSLGLHRIGILNGSTLKNREYVARGLPIVYSTTDPLLEGKWFAYKLESNETSVKISDIVDFYNSIYSKENVTEKIREETKSICDMSVAMKPVLDYLRMIR